MNSSHLISRSVWSAACLLVSALPSAAFEDAASGFRITPPQPFSVQRSVEKRPYDISVGLNSATGKPRLAGRDRYLCEAGFKANAENASLDRDTINALGDGEEWIAHLKSVYEKTGMIVLATGRYTLQGFRGLELEGKAPPHAPDDVRIYIAFSDTPKGHTTLRCVTLADDYIAALPQFRAIRDSITLPQ